MTKVMILRVTFDGNYGGSVDETTILPLDINGVLFDELKEGQFNEEVYVGEIEGKHSECYGDLTVNFVDLKELNTKQIADLIRESSFDEVESLFEQVESDFEEDEDVYDTEKAEDILKLHGVDVESMSQYAIKTSEVYDKFIEQLVEEYVQKFKTISVLEKDYDKAIKTLGVMKIDVF